jgi:predicted secreted protein
MRRFAAIVALVLLAAGCTVTRHGDERPAERKSREPTWEFTLEDTSLRVEPGDTFVIVVDDNASVGDMWSLSEEPDARVVDSAGDYYVSESDEGSVGGGGKRYFRFLAVESGTTAIELRNCFRGCADTTDDQRYAFAVEVT